MANGVARLSTLATGAGRAAPAWRRRACDARPARRRKPRTGPASGAATRSPPRSPIPSARSHRIWVTREAAAHSTSPPAIPVTFADVADLGRLVPRDAPHQGIVVEVERLRRHLARRSARPSAEDGRPLLVLDQVTDPHNVGAILRSAAAFDALGIVTQDRHAPPESGALAKAAIGRAGDRALGARGQSRPRARRDGRGRLLADRAGRRGGARRSPRRSARRASRWCSAPRARACATIRRRIATRWRGCRSARDREPQRVERRGDRALCGERRLVRHCEHSEATQSGRGPSGLPRRFAPRNDAGINPPARSSRAGRPAPPYRGSGRTAG